MNPLSELISEYMGSTGNSYARNSEIFDDIAILQSAISNHPRFKEFNPEKINFQPVDNDVYRMIFHGCYNGDSFKCDGITYIFDESDIDELSFLPNTLDEENQEIDEKTKKRIYFGDLKDGDCVLVGPFKYIYLDSPEYKHLERLSGWSVECIDKITPFEDMVMLDSLFGAPVVYGRNCFKDCYNVASVAHIPNFLKENPACAYNFFKDSGLREVPRDLLTGSIEDVIAIKILCRNAYAIENLIGLNETMIKAFGEPYDTGLLTFDTYNVLNQALTKFKLEKQMIASAVDNNFIPYENCEEIKLILKPEGQINKEEIIIENVYRTKTADEKYLILNPFIKRTIDDIKFPDDRILIEEEEFIQILYADIPYMPTINDGKEISVETFYKELISNYDYIIPVLEEKLEKELGYITLKIVTAQQKATDLQMELNYIAPNNDYSKIFSAS